jgi:ParB/RepB/Spo0J family partition protein
MKRASVTAENAHKMAGADLLDRLLEREGLPEGGLAQEIPLDRIVPDPNQPRKSFSEASLAELAASIREVGVLQPILVSRDGRDHYRLVTGERRYRASKLAGLASIPAVVVDPLASEERLIRQIIENIQREDLNDMDRARALEDLKAALNISWEETARRVGLTEGRVHQLRRLKHLAEPIQEDIRAGLLSEKESRPYQGLARAEQIELHQLRQSEGLTAREIAWVAGELKKGVPGYTLVEAVREVRAQEPPQAEVPPPPAPLERLEKAITALEREWQELDLARADHAQLARLLDELGQRLAAMRAALETA